jgi:hypothetical protein
MSKALLRPKAKWRYLNLPNRSDIWSNLWRDLAITFHGIKHCKMFEQFWQILNFLQGIGCRLTGLIRYQLSLEKSSHRPMIVIPFFCKTAMECSHGV